MSTPLPARHPARLAPLAVASALAVAALATACGAATPTSTTAAASSVPAGSADVPGSSVPRTAVGSSAPAAAPSGASVVPASPGRHVVTLDVDGQPRTAVLQVPDALTAPAPLVLAFHGHGGSGANFDRKLQIEKLWPEAIVVYPDGLVGHAGKTDPEGNRPGWQNVVGGEGDRDLHFYDALLAAVRSSLPVDPDRIFVMGHSNGSAFTSLLLNQRGDAIAATANLSAQPGPLLATDPVRSMFMMMGEKDPIVPYEGQARSIPLAEQKLGVTLPAETTDRYLRTATGPGHHELAVYVHPAGHEVPDEVPPLVVDFFRRHTLSGG